jgi:hypothetical protein
MKIHERTEIFMGIMHQTGIVQQAMFDYHGAWGLKSEIGELSLPKIGMQDD